MGRAIRLCYTLPNFTSAHLHDQYALFLDALSGVAGVSSGYIWVKVSEATSA
jgi:hypothetical protein